MRLPVRRCVQVERLVAFSPRSNDTLRLLTPYSRAVVVARESLWRVKQSYEFLITPGEPTDARENIVVISGIVLWKTCNETGSINGFPWECWLQRDTLVARVCFSASCHAIVDTRADTAGCLV